MYRLTRGASCSALMKKTVAVAAAAVVVMGTASCSTPAAAEDTAPARDEATVIRVVDGDTLVVDLDDEEVTVRLLNVDTPETKDPNEPVQCLGPEATDFLKKALPAGSTVALEYDVEREDRYGRTLAGVYDAKDRLMNAEVARQGLGFPVTYGKNVRFRPPVDEAYQEARERKLGLYSTTIACTVPAMVGTAEQAAAQAAAAGTGSTADEAAAAVAAAYALVKIADETADAVEKALKTSESMMWHALSDAERTSLKARTAAAKTAVHTRHDQLVILQDQRRAAEDEAARVAAAAEAERVAAEAARAEADRIAAAQAEANRIAAAQAEANRVAAAQAEANRQAQQQYAPPQYVAPPPAQSNPYPGYNGPRCYAPGGKSWRPC